MIEPMIEQTVNDIANRVETLEAEESSPLVFDPRDWTAPFWSCEMLLSATVAGLGSSDWDPTFDDPMNSRVAYEESSASGRFFTLIGNSVAKPVRARWGFQNDGEPFSTPGVLYGDSFGRVQIKVNGQLTQYTSSTDITFNFGAGFNLLQVSVSEAMDKVELYIQTIDRIVANWVNPNIVRTRRLAGGRQSGSSGGPSPPVPAPPPSP